MTEPPAAESKLATDGDDTDDLTPRPAATRRRRGRWSMVVLGVVVVVIAWLVWSLLSGASLFFRNVDQAVAERDELGEQRFRLQGTVVAGSVVETTVDEVPAVAFTVRYDCVLADVVHVGSPPQLFQDDIPVVLEGHWAAEADTMTGVDSFALGANDGYVFASDDMLVKHDNEYVADSGEKIVEADEGGDDCGDAGS